MKSDKASALDVRKETYCRHGFHDWFETNKDENGKPPPAGFILLKCSNCGRIKLRANPSN